MIASLAALVTLLPPQPLSRRALIGHSAAAAVSLSTLPGHAVAAEQPLPLPPSAIVLEIAENTNDMRNMMLQSAKDAESMTPFQRSEAGRRPISRNEIAFSVDAILKNSKLATLPNGGEAADTLRGVKVIAAVGQGELTSDEYTAIAKQYKRANEELKVVFDGLPAEDQEKGREIARKRRAEVAARVKAFEEEQEKVRAARARIAEENSKQATEGQGAEPPRRTKTLAELEAANRNSGFGKEQQPVLSLYAR